MNLLDLLERKPGEPIPQKGHRHLGAFSRKDTDESIEAEVKRPANALCFCCKSRHKYPKKAGGLSSYCRECTALRVTKRREDLKNQTGLPQKNPICPCCKVNPKPIGANDNRYCATCLTAKNHQQYLIRKERNRILKEKAARGEA